MQPLSLLLLVLLARASHSFLLLLAGGPSPGSGSSSSPLRRPLHAPVVVTAPSSSLLAPCRQNLLPLPITSRGLRGGVVQQQKSSSVQPRPTQGQWRAGAVASVVKGATVLALAGAVVAGGWWRPAAAWAAKQGAAAAGSGEHLHLGQRVANAIRRFVFASSEFCLRG